MNIVRALDVALPELPQQIVRKNPPKLDPNVIAKEHLEKGKLVIITKAPGSEWIFRFTPLQWQLLQMFDRCVSTNQREGRHRKIVAALLDDCLHWSGGLRTRRGAVAQFP